MECGYRASRGGSYNRCPMDIGSDTAGAIAAAVVVLAAMWWYIASGKDTEWQAAKLWAWGMLFLLGCLVIELCDWLLF